MWILILTVCRVVHLGANPTQFLCELQWVYIRWCRLLNVQSQPFHAAISATRNFSTGQGLLLHRKNHGKGAQHLGSLIKSWRKQLLTGEMRFGLGILELITTNHVYCDLSIWEAGFRSLGVSRRHNPLRFAWWSYLWHSAWCLCPQQNTNRSPRESVHRSDMRKSADWWLKH